MISNKRGSLRVGDGDIGFLECLAVDDAEAAAHGWAGPFARAEASFAADKQRQFALYLAAVRLQKTDQTAKVVLVPVAEYKRVDACGINTKQIRVVEKCFRRETKINQDMAPLVAASRLDLHREAEFADQCSARRLVAETPAEVLDVEVGQLPARRDCELIAVNHDPDCDAIELRH